MKYNINTDIDIITESPMQEKAVSTSITVRKGGKEITYDNIMETSVTGPMFVQVYKEGLVPLSKLSSVGTSILYYIFDNIQFGYNNIIIHQPKVAEALNISQPSVSRGINDLLENKVLFKSKTPYTYIINHNYFFKGPRKEYEDWLNENINNKANLYNNEKDKTAE